MANPVKLVGNRKAGARFGTSIMSLGDIDLDSYNDIAIAAPYEDDGVGAVYIYMGSKTGVQTTYSQRLSPLNFPGYSRSTKGFGQGLSKGVDVDGNGHNDIAIGAYKSNRVFLIRTLSVVDYRLTLEPNVTSISSSDMNVTFCVYYTQRSPTKNLKTLQFGIELQLDYRVPGKSHFTYNFNAEISKTFCKFLIVTVQKSPLDITPFKLTLKSEIFQKGIIGKGENKIEKSIPFSHGCGSDNICQTQILLETISNLPHIILGLNKELTVNVSAENVGEPGYACELHMNFSNVLELRNTRDCNLENSTYICPFSNRFENVSKTIQLKFDIKLTKPSLDRVKYNFELKCLGVNVPADASKSELELDIISRNSPYIQGSSSPTNFYFTDENLETDVEVSHNFRIGNAGPSPIKLDVFLVLPIVKRDEIDIFDIDAKGSLNGIEVQCSPTNRTFKMEKTYNVTTLLTEPLNRTIVIDCFEEDVECLVLFCVGDYLYKPTEIAEYNVKITTRTELLAAHFRNELAKKDILTFVSSAYIFNNTHRVEGHAATMIYTSKSKPVPLWIYIAAGILGIILLALLVFILYKCHFFDRNYRDKLNDEKLMEQRSDDGMDDNMDPVTLEELPSN
ncbi:integrin alpha-5-like [Anoplophora glabripennis]|uniref:integrin alpha-5-like n=1 Tax=Anoplophora glabripennis TaxID=217634 RepID=UPI000C789DA9|nr:integrin alpha-5-like [Anoplophora glabripennis]